jgi:hypothetical protein
LLAEERLAAVTSIVVPIEKIENSAISVVASDVLPTAP